MSRPTDGLGFGFSDTYSSAVCHHILLIWPGASKRQDAIKQECWAESLVVPVDKEKPLLLSFPPPLCAVHAELHTGPYIMDSGGLKTEQSHRNRRLLHGRKDLHHSHFRWCYSI